MLPAVSEPAVAPESRVCLVIPAVGNADRLASTIQEALRVTGDVIVSLDAAEGDDSGIQERFPGIAVARTATRCSLIANGIRTAAEKGYSHAITLQPSTGLPGTDARRMLEAIREHPRALIVSVPDRQDGRAGRRGRRSGVLSALLLWTQTGRWIAEVSGGPRVYPLIPLAELNLGTGGCGYERECLVKAAWAGIEVLTIPVEARPLTEDRRRRQRPFADRARALAVNGCWLIQRIHLPGALRRIMVRRSFHQAPLRRRLGQICRHLILPEGTTPALAATAIGIGVFFGILPIWGFQMAAAALVAHRLKLSKPLALTASNISFPLMIPAILYASVVIGRLVLAGRLDLSLSLGADPKAAVMLCLLDYLVGSVMLAVLAGLAAGALSYGLIRIFRERKGAT